MSPEINKIAGYDRKSKNKTKIVGGKNVGQRKVNIVVIATWKWPMRLTCYKPDGKSSCHSD